jgi:hypothetical protein
LGWLTHYENFADIVPSEKELQGTIVAEQILDVAVVENALEAEVRVPA